MEGVLKLKDKPVAQFYLDSAMVFTPGSIHRAKRVLSLKISDLSVLLSGQLTLDETLLDHVVLDSDATFRSGGIRKIHFNNIAAKNSLTYEKNSRLSLLAILMNAVFSLRVNARQPDSLYAVQCFDHFRKPGPYGNRVEIIQSDSVAIRLNRLVKPTVSLPEKCRDSGSNF